jgi:site-specific recombinase XerD
MRQRGVFEKFPGSGVWWIRHSDSTGRIRREKAGTKSAALQLYRKRKMQTLEGKKLPERLRAPLISFTELAQDCLAYSKAHKRSYHDDVNRMERLLGWFRDWTADSVTPQDIERRMTEAAEENDWAPATVNRLRALISLTYRLGIESGKVSTNPAKLVKHRQENNARIRWLTPEEELRLRAAIVVLEESLSEGLSETVKAKRADHLLELDLALNTGMRLGEMYGLTWENVNLSRRVLTIPRSKNGELRHVPLNTTALAALQTLKAQADGTGPVFRNADGGRLTGPRYWFEPAIKAAKIRTFSWHCLRHTFASRLVMAGVDIRTVQELMGHKCIAMTVRYAHLAPTHQLAAVERLTGEPIATDSKRPTDTKTSTGQNEQSEPQAVYHH